jgi:hypothetical protein
MGIRAGGARDEYRLHEQRGLPPPMAPANSSSPEEEEESNGGRPPPPSPRAVEAAVELVPTAGAEAPAIRLSVEVPAGAVGAPASATETAPEPSSKRKRGVSNLR